MYNSNFLNDQDKIINKYLNFNTIIISVMKDNMYSKLEKSCLQVLSYGDNDLKKSNVGKSLILLLTNRDQSHQCRQRPAIKIKKK